MFIEVNNHCFRLDEIVAFYPCDAEGNFSDNKKQVLIRFKDGAEVMYTANYYDFVFLLNKGGLYV